MNPNHVNIDVVAGGVRHIMQWPLGTPIPRVGEHILIGEFSHTVKEVAWRNFKLAGGVEVPRVYIFAGVRKRPKAWVSEGK